MKTIDLSTWAYFDYAATTPIHPQVATQFYEDIQQGAVFANTGSSHDLGLFNRQRLETARAQLAQVLGADSREIVFTSGATESNNLALKGALGHHQVKNPRVVTLQSEHKAVLDTVGILAKQGVDCVCLPVQADGRVDLTLLEEALQTPTTLLSVMAVNNETGVVQPIAEIAELVQRYGAKLHVDAAQAVGKFAIDVEEWQADMVSLTAHKIYGLPGIGALFVRRLPKMRLQAQQHGGGQERGRRSGTMPLALIRAFALAAELGADKLDANRARVEALYQRLETGLPAQMTRNGAGVAVPHIVNIDTKMMAAEVLQRANAEQIAISSGSACSADKDTGSHVLQAMGLSEAATRSIRVSLSHLTTTDEVDKLVRFLQNL